MTMMTMKQHQQPNLMIQLQFMVAAVVAIAVTCFSVATASAAAASGLAVPSSVHVTHYKGTAKKGKVQVEESLTYPKALEASADIQIGMKHTLRIEFDAEVNAFHQVSLLLVPSASGVKETNPLTESVPASKSLLVPYVKNAEKFRLDVTSKKLNIDSHDKESWPMAGGTYDVRLFLASAKTGASTQTWTLAKSVHFDYPTLGDMSPIFTDDPESDVFWAKDEIRHVFPPPEVHVGKATAGFFSLVVLVVPWAFLFITWGYFGVNIQKFPWTSASLIPTLVFIASLTAMMGLFAVAWLKLQFFTTLQYLAVIGVVASVSGQQALSSVAKNRQD